MRCPWTRPIWRRGRELCRTLREIAGTPPVLDLALLGLGPDGHTASLVPGDPALKVADRDVAITGVYQGRRRMTLTYPMLDRSRNILWVVTGVEKVPMLKRLQDGDASIPAGRIRRDPARILADRAAAGAGARNDRAGETACAEGSPPASPYNCDSMGRMPRNPMPSRFQNPV